MLQTFHCKYNLSGKFEECESICYWRCCCIDVCSDLSGWCLDQQSVAAQPGLDKLFIQQAGNEALQHNNTMVLLLQHCQNTWQFAQPTILCSTPHYSHLQSVSFTTWRLENLPPLFANKRTQAFHSRSRFKYDVEMCSCGGLTQFVTSITMPVLRPFCFHHRRERAQRSQSAL